MEIHDLSGIERMEAGFVISVLVPAAEIGVAIVIVVGIFYAVFNGAGKICFDDVNRFWTNHDEVLEQYLCSMISIPPRRRVR